MKICNKCKQYKELLEFHKNKNKPDGFHIQCKSCVSEYSIKNRELQRARNIKWNKINPERRKQLQQEDYQKNSGFYKKYSLQYSKDNSIEVKKKRKIYNDLNKFSINKKAVERKNKRRKNDPLYKLSSNIRTSISRSFNRLLEGKFKKSQKTEQILGCSFQEFKLYLESKFEPWMTWGNHGLYNGKLNYGWDIDHIIPISSAQTEEEIYKLNYYTNFQPLCSKINRDIKIDKINYEKTRT